MNSIIVILPYFGKLPEMFPFWLESCKQNETINFLIVTDQQISSSAQNIKNLNSSLFAIKKKIETVLGMKVWLEKPYKLCDFKAIYNKIFYEHVDKYDFWGYCDCDLIFGDIRAFLTDELLNSYDYILGLGHFHIQRTKDEKYERVWKSARGLWHNIQWREVFASSQNEWFDELPYGVAGQYYTLYPDKFWSGFSIHKRCYESPITNIPTFIDGYNCYDSYIKDPAYQNHIDRLQFWKREKCSELKNIVYIKEGIKLYSVGINARGGIEKHQILYAHFYKRPLSAQTQSLTKYIIRPNAIVKYKKPNKILLWWYAHNPILRFSIFYHRIMKKLKFSK